MNETMINTIEDAAEDAAVEVKPTLSTGAAMLIGGAIATVVIIVGNKIVKAVKANKAKRMAETTTVELSEDDYSEVE